MKTYDGKETRDMSPEEEANFLARKQAFEAAMTGTPDDTARITKLETRLSSMAAAYQKGVNEA